MSDQHLCVKCFNAVDECGEIHCAALSGLYDKVEEVVVDCILFVPIPKPRYSWDPTPTIRKGDCYFNNIVKWLFVGGLFATAIVITVINVM